MKYLIVTLFMIFNLSVTEIAKARIIDLKEECGENLSAKEFVDWIKQSGRNDTLKCSAFDVVDDIDFKFENIDTIQSALDFYDVQFLGSAIFDSSIFLNNVRLEKSEFHKNASFNHARFYSNVRLEKTQFSGNADFNDTQYFEEVSFKSTQFSKNAMFFRTLFSSDVYLNFTIFSNRAAFYGANFLGNAFFTRAKFLEDLEFGDTHFTNLYFFEVEINYFSFFWNELKWKISTDYLSEIRGLRKSYLVFENYLESKGEFEIMDDCYFERKLRETWIHLKDISPLFIIDLIMLLSCGYGVMPEFTIATSAVFIMLFALAYYHLGAIQERKRERDTSSSANRND